MEPRMNADKHGFFNICVHPRFHECWMPDTVHYWPWTTNPPDQTGILREGLVRQVLRLMATSNPRVLLLAIEGREPESNVAAPTKTAPFEERPAGWIRYLVCFL